MANTKPVPPTHLVKGKLLECEEHKGFVATFNWLLDWVSNFRCGKGIKIEYEPDSSHPRISIDEDELGPGANITISGTDDTSHKGDTFTIKSAQYSNITATVGSNGDITIGAFYI